MIGSVVLAIATDLFAPQMRGRVMGLIQTAFAASQVLGMPDRPVPVEPLGLARAVPRAGRARRARPGRDRVKLQPVDDHLARPQEHSPFMHLFHTVTEPRYLLAFLDGDAC